MLTKEQIDDLLKQQKELQDKLTLITKEQGQDDGRPKSDVIQKEELKNITDTIITEMESRGLMKKDRKMVFGEKEELKDNERRIPLGHFLLMVKHHHPKIAEMAMQDIFERNEKTVMSEGTPAQGGYTVPVEYANEIIGAISDLATIIPKCTPYPQISNTKLMPKWLTGITVSWVAEDGTKTLTKPTLTQLTSTLKKIVAGPIPFTDEYLEDDSAGIVAGVTKLVAEAIANEIERIILVGDVTGLTDPFNGIRYATGTNLVPQVGANLGYGDIVGIWNNANVLETYTKGTMEWYLTKSVLGLIMNIVDLQNRPLWNLGSLSADVPPNILGDKYNKTSNILNTYGDGGDESCIIYGDYKYVLLGERKGKAGINVAVSNSAIASTEGAVTQNAFMQDETWYRFVKRQGILVAIAAAFSVGTGIK